MINMSAQYRQTYEALAKQIPFEPEICVVLGSGLGDFAEKVETIKSIPTSSLPNYPVSRSSRFFALCQLREQKTFNHSRKNSPLRRI